MTTTPLGSLYRIILYSAFVTAMVCRPSLARAQAAPAPQTPAPAAPAQAETPLPVITIVGEEFRVELQVGAWITMPTTVMYSDTEDITVTSGTTTTTTALNGTLLDFKRDLGLNNQTFPEAHLTVRLAPKHKLRGEYIPIFYKQTAVIASTFNFNGQTYKAGDTVESTMHWNEWQFAYEFDPLVVDRGYIGGVVAVSSMNVSGATADSAQSGTASVNILMPGLGVTARYYAASKLSVTGDFMFFDLPGSETSTHARSVDISGYATFNFNKHIGAQVGYRSYDASHVWGSPLNTGQFTIRGPFVGGTAHF